LDVDELADTCPKVITPKMKVKFIGLPSTSLKDEQDKLNEEGLLFDVIDNLIYLGNAKMHNNTRFYCCGLHAKIIESQCL